MTTFWFGRVSPRPLALQRIGLGIVLLWDTAAHAGRVVEAYSSDGLAMPLPSLSAWGLVPPSLPPGWSVALHGLLMFGLVASACGFLTRPSLLMSAALLAYFSLLDFPGTLNKYVAIGLHLLILVACSDSQAVWSVDRRLCGRPDRVRLAVVWPRRLMQFLVCHVYVGAAITKLRMRDFAIGDTLAFSLVDDRWAGGWLGTWPGAWMSTQPRLVVLASFATLGFEIAFPLLIWFRRTRRPMLLAAFAFHLALACCLDLGVFSPLMFVALLAFVDESDLALVARLVSGRATKPAPIGRAAGRRRSYRAIVAVSSWALLACVAMAGSYVVHAAFDPAFSGGSPPAHVRVDDERAESMLAGSPASPAAHVHRIDVGRRASNFQVFGGVERLRPGDQLHAQMRLAADHPPLNVEVVLVDPNGEIVVSQPGYVPARLTHWWVGFALTDAIPAGTAALEFQVQGELVERREFEFEGSPP